MICELRIRRNRDCDNVFIDCKRSDSFSMTLVDTLDTLVLLGDFDEFERASRMVIDTVQFDSDIVVSVFETNIRMVG